MSKTAKGAADAVANAPVAPAVPDVVLAAPPAPPVDLVRIKFELGYRPEGSPEGTKIKPGQEYALPRAEARRVSELGIGKAVI